MRELHKLSPTEAQFVAIARGEMKRLQEERYGLLGRVRDIETSLSSLDVNLQQQIELGAQAASIVERPLTIALDGLSIGVEDSQPGAAAPAPLAALPQPETATGAPAATGVPAELVNGVSHGN